MTASTLKAERQHLGDWMQTFTGRQFWPLDPDIEAIDIVDIAHSLSMQCRYAGHCRNFYSVAEHSVLMTRALSLQDESADVQLWALLHDATEAYLVDLPRPVKPFLQGYVEAEDALMRVIAQRFALSPDMPQAVKIADRRILADELHQNMSEPPEPWGGMLRPLGVQIRNWSPAMAKASFLREFYRIQGRRQ